MSKDCELCGKPLKEWPDPRLRMDGSQKMAAWLGCVAMVSFVGLVVVLQRGCTESNRQDALRMQAEAAAQADKVRACIGKAEDPAVCLGKVETVRCLPPKTDKP